MDYEHLEGKEIDYICGNSKLRGLVVGVDRDIGITIVNAKNHEHFLTCVNGPSSGHVAYANDLIDIEAYNKVFDHSIEMLEQGKFDIDLHFNTMSIVGLIYGFEPSLNDCPYNR
jgi:hypothetical protein